jgi:hypothetical protein
MILRRRRFLREQVQATPTHSIVEDLQAALAQSGLPSMSSAPAISIVEDLQAALTQFAEWSRWEASDIDGLSREAEMSGSE